ncbi:MAG: hypothetical protein ABS44_11880 [Chryseobacterium sp. SCN 40-13]|nr:MAG: hypothetical protein ABS44_11880 [Chryseobacterium sp. SCN 40-13]
MNNLLPQSIQQPHIIAFDLLMKQRLEEIGMNALLVYMIDTVDESALYFLAKQFDVLGYNGWKLAHTDDKKRALIKQAIELHRFKGTVWSIKEALKTVGFPDATITEHVSHWAGFTVQLNIGNTPINADAINSALEMVKAYKNARSHLMGFEFKIEFESELTITDDSYEAPGDDYGDSLFMGGDFTYNGAHQHDGSKNYSSDTDILELTII